LKQLSSKYTVKIVPDMFFARVARTYSLHCFY
jgi:hypothetical protein